MFDRIFFVIGEAWVGLRRNLGMALISILTVAISLFMVGGLAYVYLEANRIAEPVAGSFAMYVRLKEGTDAASIQETASVIRRMDGVRSVNWIPREKAWARMQKLQPEFTEGIANPLPDALKVTLGDLQRGDAVAEEIAALPAVPPKGVNYLAGAQRLVSDVLRWLQMLNVLGGLLLLIAGVLIYNTIRLAAIARKTEVRIMRLVGASRLAIAAPFLLEGLVQGVVGGGLSAFFLYAITAVASYQARMQPDSALIKVLDPARSAVEIRHVPIEGVMLAVVALGAAYGVFCSLIALRVRPETR